MSLIIALILGAIIGWSGARLVGRHEGVFGSILIGIVGAAIGGFIAQLFGTPETGFLVLTWPSILWSLAGAVLLSVVLNAVQRRATHHHV